MSTRSSARTRRRRRPAPSERSPAHLFLARQVKLQPACAEGSVLSNVLCTWHSKIATVCIATFQLTTGSLQYGQLHANPKSLQREHH